ncbi:hypothetical protein SAMN05444161_0054 [Rhizobiales bacterium GAS191]|jgi:hypothetical protein|nr:hypothetical protein SAMN05519103_07536 [Rhizobiales bacterium GAS113]SEB87528.1 hypothetical protein SAMN05444161_0054 [Rhizobiales bacterium GAS191]SED29906.1 hypothetical protein SAMN05519104_3253 [Rhizobiales bacterium GAS188]
MSDSLLIRSTQTGDALRSPICHHAGMASKILKAIIERVESWPEDRQEDAARLLLAMEEQDASSYRLTDEQVEEVERRRAKLYPKFHTLEETRQRFARRRA